VARSGIAHSHDVCAGSARPHAAICYRGWRIVRELHCNGPLIAAGGWQLAVRLLCRCCITQQHGGSRLHPARLDGHVAARCRARNAVILQRKVQPRVCLAFYLQSASPRLNCFAVICTDEELRWMLELATLSAALQVNR